MMSTSSMIRKAPLWTDGLNPYAPRTTRATRRPRGPDYILIDGADYSSDEDFTACVKQEPLEDFADSGAGDSQAFVLTPQMMSDALKRVLPRHQKSQVITIESDSESDGALEDHHAFE
jgi:hypothetical protein